MKWRLLTEQLYIAPGTNAHLKSMWPQLTIHKSISTKVISCTNIVSVNSSAPSAAYMRWRTRSTLVRVIARCLFDAKPLPNPMLISCQLDLYEQTLVNFHQNTKLFIHENVFEDDVCQTEAILSRGDELKFNRNHHRLYKIVPASINHHSLHGCHVQVRVGYISTLVYSYCEKAFCILLLIHVSKLLCVISLLFLCFRLFIMVKYEGWLWMTEKDRHSMVSYNLIDTCMIFGLEQGGGGGVIAPMALAHSLHLIDNRSRNKRRNLWVGRWVFLLMTLVPVQKLCINIYIYICVCVCVSAFLIWVLS